MNLKFSEGDSSTVFVTALWLFKEQTYTLVHTVLVKKRTLSIWTMSAFLRYGAEDGAMPAGTDIRFDALAGNAGLGCSENCRARD
jgi:hypothetical protein